MKKWNLIGSLALATMLLAACGDNNAQDKDTADTGDKKVLEMATSADFPPFESRDTAGEFEGFDIDLANYIADELGYELKINDMKFDGLIGALQNDRVDMVLSGMSATDKRKENVDFSTEYNHSGEMLITLKDSKLKSIEDLKGKTIGVQLGTIQEDGAKKIKAETVDIEIKAVDNANVLIQELLSNRIDAAYMDKAVAKGYIAEQDLEGFDDPTTSSPGMGIAFPKGSDLVEKVNAVLKEAEENGKLQEMKDKWLSEE
ncbi:transporter substrate-binding domain-containing protein [Paenisporosarcina sp. OV554]|uniref:transporter substrate-binding domain-containing protein n=1 Tax=Paenisporosarcina sp. OV554 TaxID=2135694 RepID=UPI000D3CD0ED|nr:transporter substrate-binding domain-containing protein [Paenisporosarcina sp. OV554]PUB16592.1 polar amino acid transport system substrate-binding protein [Paenisporosarcina sp. OV554]